MCVCVCVLVRVRVCVCVCLYFVNSTWLILQLIYGDVRFRWFVDDVPQDSHEQVLNVNFATMQRYVLTYVRICLLIKKTQYYVYMCVCVFFRVYPLCMYVSATYVRIYLML